MAHIDTSHSDTTSLHRTIARLVVAMLVADDRLSSQEVDGIPRLDRAGFGPLCETVKEEIQRAARIPIDLRATCDALGGTGSALVGAVLSLLARIAAGDGTIEADEAQVFGTIASRLGAKSADIRDYLESRPSAPPVSAGRAAAASKRGAALAALGLAPDATRAALDAAYLRLAARYDPARMAALGAEFVVLTVRRLAHLADLYEEACTEVKH